MFKIKNMIGNIIKMLPILTARCVTKGFLKQKKSKLPFLSSLAYVMIRGYSAADLTELPMKIKLTNKNELIYLN